MDVWERVTIRSDHVDIGVSTFRGKIESERREQVVSEVAGGRGEIVSTQHERYSVLNTSATPRY
ncbi:hypothetical protein J6590_029853 [Homalodisca vitripennis]|nr:hypothetical protein J6590_029853 [Homalodisca vitripennis]